MNNYIATITAELHKLYVQDTPPTVEQVTADAEEDGLSSVEVLSIKEFDTPRMN